MLAPPPGAGFETTIGKVPAVCRSDGGIVTSTDVGEAYLTASGVFPERAIVVAVNPVPLNITVAATRLPAGTFAGVTICNAGMGFDTAKPPGPAALPPPGAGLIAPFEYCPRRRNDDVSVAINKVDDLNVVGMGVPANVIVEAAEKFEPVTLMFRTWVPASTLVGEKPVTVGGGLTTLSAAAAVPPPGPGFAMTMEIVPALASAAAESATVADVGDVTVPV